MHLLQDTYNDFLKVQYVVILQYHQTSLGRYCGAAHCHPYSAWRDREPV